MTEWNVSREAAELHADALVWDMTLPILTPGAPASKAAILPRFARAGFDFASITLAIDGMDFTAAMQQIADHRRLVAERDDVCVLADSTDAILEARRQGRLAVGLHFQGTDPFEENPGWVDLFYALGIRHALLAYNERNRVGCGCHVPVDTGLTPFGRSLIRELNRVGMLVDCAHTGDRTSMEAIEASTSPVIVSHTNARALCDHPRCAPDELIRACAARGGVLGITGISAFLGEGGATVERLVDHVDHLAELVGPQHVGLGLDHVYDLASFQLFVDRSPERYPAESNYRNLRQLAPEDGPRITQELLRRGYAASEIRGILGENWLRVCRAVWR